MVLLAMRALVYAYWEIGTEVGVGGRIGLCEEFLEGVQHLHFQFDEVLQFLIILGGHCIDKLCSGLENMIRCVIS